ncbi:hypothetical protein POM88_040955 [Heracleum sosnowskyi]|uniref:Uncharacterized protein n=1 Tax=Heracleum sosnowskyi TaxID=360622 RepID=A0AAD8HDW7_9APIA|nr:hypothetical protein POM88_040955 [Heracleum sosnowskyi]
MAIMWHLRFDRLSRIHRLSNFRLPPVKDSTLFKCKLITDRKKGCEDSFKIKAVAMPKVKRGLMFLMLAENMVSSKRKGHVRPNGWAYRFPKTNITILIIGLQVSETLGAS